MILKNLMTIIIVPIPFILVNAINIRSMQRQDMQTIPIIALTANAFTEDMQATSKAGMNAHITKPINYNILFRTIYQFIVEKNNK